MEKFSPAVVAVWNSDKETACWYVALADKTLWRAWVWGDFDGPPDRAQQDGYRWEAVARYGVLFG
jgi:hypothetical protein